MSCDIDNFELHKERFQKFIQELSLKPDQVYNADKSDFFGGFY